MTKRLIFFLIFCISIIILPSCSAPANDDISINQLTITVSILPQKYFIERIGGNHVEVNVMVGPGESPHSYEPKAAQMTALSQSVVYFKIGVEFEAVWMERMQSINPDMRIMDLSEDIVKIEMATHDQDEGGSDKENAESHHDEVLDPHIWTSPENGRVIAQKVFETLADLDPLHQEEYRSNLEHLLADIQNLQDDIQTSISGLENREFMAFHPAWGYFADEFNLTQIPIEVGGTEPSAQELAQVIQEAKNKNIRVIFAQPEFSTRSAEYIASEIGGKVILISPLAEDWLENLRQVADTMGKEL